MAQSRVDLVSSRDACTARVRGYVSERAFPRYFVPSRARAEAQPSSSAPSPLAHCADSFHLISGGTTQEVIVGVDRAGELGYALGAEHDGLSEQALRELGVHELSCASAGRPAARALHAERLFLFELEFLEQVSGQDLNQPVYAYGTLIGPLASGNASARVPGQLTMTRADLLEGFALGSAYPFRCAEALGGARAVHHALLPGSREEETAQGRDLVLAYPLAPAELSEEDLENGAIVQLLVAELVSGLRKDLEREERARGLLQKWFGSDRAATLTEPETPDFAASMALVTAALRCIPEWPSPRARALRARLASEPLPSARLKSEPARPAARSLSPALTPAPPAVAAPAPRAPLWKKPGDAPPDWTRDFLPAQHQDDPAASYVTWKAPRAAKKLPRDTDWMEDFHAPAQSGDANEAAEREENPQQRAERATRPDWMRDFDDE